VVDDCIGDGKMGIIATFGHKDSGKSYTIIGQNNL
jgi:hypothetical protein